MILLMDVCFGLTKMEKMSIAFLNIEIQQNF